MAGLPKFYFMVSVSGGHWVGTGSQPLWLLLAIALAFSISLWGIGQLLEFITRSRQKNRSVEIDNALSGLENIDIPTGNHVAEISHMPHCDGIDLSCFDGVHH